jgi:hypothetical protein
MGVFEGCLGKCVVERVVFCGENVVDCVVNVENDRSFIWRRKIGQGLGIYFRGNLIHCIRGNLAGAAVWNLASVAAQQ